MQNEYSIVLHHELPLVQTQTLSEPEMLQRKLETIRNLLASLQVELENFQLINLPEINEEFDFYREVARYETNLIESALRMSGGTQVKAARLLKLKPTTLNSKMKALKLLPK